MQTPPTTLQSNTANDLLAERERRALRISAFTRIVIGSISAIIIVGITNHILETISLFFMLLIFIGAQVFILHALKTRPQTNWIGMFGAILDALILCIMPIIWHIVYTTEDEPLVHLSRHNLTAVSLAIVALNGLSLRPKYPALLTAITTLLHVTLAILALTDHRLEHFPYQLSGALGVGMSGLDLLVVTPLFVACAGILITLATQAARTLVKEAVTREQTEHHLREQHLQNVMEAKMAAVGNLVAGVEHEINNPLGALHSATDTAKKAIDRFRATQSNDTHSKDAQRALTILEQSLNLTNQASQRLAQVMATIRGFVHLDRAEMQHTDLAELIQTILDVQKSAFRPDTTITTHLEPNIKANIAPRRITEALTTVISNAAEAFDTPGEVTVSLQKENDRAIITIQDTGKGMPPEQLENLFEIDFAHGARTHARFGLAICRSILHSHNGDIKIDSELGRGTTVKIQLPLTTQK